MKRLTLLLILMVAAGVTFYFTSCKKDPKYSCDEKAHKYAAMHLDASQSIKRDSLVKLERGLQFAVFRSLSPENKKRIFNEKIDILLSTLDLKESERTHLLALKNYFEPNIYGNNEETPFLQQWELKAKNTLGWTDNMIQGMVGTWATPQELVTMAGFHNMESAVGACTCSYNAGCAWFGDCKGGCIETWDGCGITGWSKCTGDCPNDRTGISSGAIAK